MRPTYDDDLYLNTRTHSCQHSSQIKFTNTHLLAHLISLYSSSQCHLADMLIVTLIHPVNLY